MKTRILIAMMGVFLCSTRSLVAQSTGVIRGRVTDAGNGQPIPVATVSVTGRTQGAVTNANGEYTLSGIAPGQVQVTARRIGRGHGALQRKLRLHRANPAGIHAAHLSSAYANALSIASIENGVRLNVFTDPPCEKKRAFFFGCRLALGDDLQVGFGETMKIGILHQHAARNVLESPLLYACGNFDKAQVLLRS